MWAAKVSAAGAATADWPPGQRVKFRLAGGSSAEGEVVAHDSRAGVVVLKGEADAYTVVSLSCITDVIERLPPAAGFVPEARAAACARGWRSLRAAQPLPDHDAARAARRLDEALRAAETAAARIGEGVSRQAQTLFDAISKTHPCFWRGTSIVVMEDVVISEPYTPASCTGGSSAANERVRLVLAQLRMLEG